MARITITNTQTSKYLVPSPIRAFVGAGQTQVFDGISIPTMEESEAFLQAIHDGTIIVVVAEDPGIPDAVETGNQLASAFGTTITPTRTEEWTDPATADVDAIKASIASSASIETYTGAALDGVIGLGVMSPPRNMTVTTTVNADIDAIDVVYTGTDIDGNVLTDTITLTDGGGATDAGTAAFATVLSIVVAAQAGTGGALEFGFGVLIGLAGSILSRAGAPMVMLEVEAGAVVTTGTVVDSATGAPHGTYSPATAPDAANDYALMYEVAV